MAPRENSRRESLGVLCQSDKRLLVARGARDSQFGARLARDQLAGGKGSQSERATRACCAILGHGLGHCVELSDTELELDNAVSK